MITNLEKLQQIRDRAAAHLDRTPYENRLYVRRHFRMISAQLSINEELLQFLRDKYPEFHLEIEASVKVIRNVQDILPFMADLIQNEKAMAPIREDAADDEQ